MTSLSSGGHNSNNNNDMPPGSKPPDMLLEVERIRDVRKEDLKRHKGGSGGGGVTMGASAGLSASAALSSAAVSNVANAGSSAINASASTMSSSSSAADHLLVIVYSREDDYGEQSLVLASNNEWIVESWVDAIHLLINAKPSANMTCFVECMVDAKLMDLNTLGCEIPAEVPAIPPLPASFQFNWPASTTTTMATASS